MNFHLIWNRKTDFLCFNFLYLSNGIQIRTIVYSMLSYQKKYTPIWVTSHIFHLHFCHKIIERVSRKVLFDNPNKY